jgi:anti-sigma-K factor RskA
MTTPPPLSPDDPDDALAAEFVLGVLPLGERATVQDRIRRDSRFAARVAAWAERLAPLDDATPEVAPPPDLLDRIEARLFPTPAPRRRARFWMGLAGGAAAAAALAAAILVVVPPGPGAPPPDAPAQARAILSAELVAEDTTLVFAALWREDGGLDVTRVAGDGAGAGQDYQLWLIGDDGVPASLGLIRDGSARAVVPGLAPGLVLAVSLEPAGGSTTGQPTGPVLAAAPLAAL